MAGRPSDGIPPAGRGREEIGRSELRLASVPLTSAATPVSEATRTVAYEVSDCNTIIEFVQYGVAVAIAPPWIVTATTRSSPSPSATTLLTSRHRSPAPQTGGTSAP